MAAAVPNKSTNVRTRKSTSRSLPLALRAARAGFRVIGPYAPGLASSYAERLFLTARRHPRPAWERQALASAERLELPHDGQMLPAWRWGSGPATVLLVHGWEGRGSQLARLVEPLTSRGLSVVTFDVPGHGDAPAGLASLVEHARAILSVATHLGRLHAIIGHSVGGAAALFATRLGVRADRLALIAAPIGPERFAAGFGSMLGLDAPLQQALVGRLERRYGVRMQDLNVGMDAMRWDRPLLVVHDVGDSIVPFSDGETIARAAPSATLVTTHGLGHHRILRAPEVIDAVVPFVADGVRKVLSFTETIEGELFCRDQRW